LGAVKLPLSKFNSIPFLHDAQIFDAVRSAEHALCFIPFVFKCALADAKILAREGDMTECSSARFATMFTPQTVGQMKHMLITGIEPITKSLQRRS